MSNAQPTHRPLPEHGDAAASAWRRPWPRLSAEIPRTLLSAWSTAGDSVPVARGHLEIDDGVGRHRRQRRYAKATHGLARLVVIGAIGLLSLEALRWCAGAGIGVVVLDPADASVLSTSGACAVDDGRIRRAQALAPGPRPGWPSPAT